MADFLQVVLVGRGLVGTELLRQIHSVGSAAFPSLRVVAVARSRTTHTRDGGLNGPRFQGEEEETDLVCLPRRFISRGPTVVVDCTASDYTSSLYMDWLKVCNVVTANKKANSGNLTYYHILRRIARGNGHSFLYEANVGAGLPIISSIQDMVRTGDKFLKVEGILSGTLSYIFNEFDESKSFSGVVKAAKELGFTEPDPREDLSGTDVQRKVVILAREIGIDVELDDIPVESLVPQELTHKSVSTSEFLERLADIDHLMSNRAHDASMDDEILRYVGVVDVPTRKCSVELRRYKRSHPFARLSGSDNILSISSMRYSEQPLVIQGPGAGASVTAAGVFADILKVAMVHAVKQPT